MSPFEINYRKFHGLSLDPSPKQFHPGPQPATCEWGYHETKVHTTSITFDPNIPAITHVSIDGHEVPVTPGNLAEVRRRGLTNLKGPK